MLEERYFIVNTNITWSKKNYKEMLKQEKAAAYYQRKKSIESINKGDTIFLYHTGVGVIAYGKAIDSNRMQDIDGEKDGEYYIKLKFDWMVNPDSEPDKAVKAWEINSKLNSRHSFRHAVFSISEDMAELIKKLAKKK